MTRYVDTLAFLRIATALVWRDRMQQPLGFATHDAALAAAARQHGFAVIGA